MLKFAFLPYYIAFLFFSCISNENLKLAKSIHVNTAKDTTTNNRYCWLSSYQISNNLINRISVPDGFERINTSKGSFADWLRHLPLKEQNANVLLYNGNLKNRQDVHHAVLAIDTGEEDLQQCADACMRLKAEYHYSRGEHSKIHFKFTNGDDAFWQKWMNGYRPLIKGNKINWEKKTSIDNSYSNFKKYLKTVFQYAGSQSLSNELRLIQMNQIQPGDIFIKGGFPGHAVIVLDVAENNNTKERIFLLAQSYMPAQEIHILKNFSNKNLSPWYSSLADELETPEWTFYGQCLKRFTW